jgi:hypothetical protein
MTNDFLELLESVKAEEATVGRMFNSASDGRGIRSLTKNDPRYKRALTEAAQLVADVTSGRRPMHYLEEAMSTSDFPLLFGDIIDRTMLGKYQEWPSIWASLARRATVKDFRTVSRFKMDGAEGVLPIVPQGAEYREASVSEGRYQYSVAKYGRRIPMLWEVFVNDDLDALRDMPDRLAKAARMTEERFATEVYVDSTGPDATFFAAGNNNLATGAGSALSLSTLQTAMGAFWSQKDADGNPIFTGQLRLVVPPQLAVLARNILNATEIRNSPGATTGDQISTTNWVNNEVVSVVVNPWLPIVDTTKGTTAWYLFADPGIGRPAMEMGFLRGHETPELFMKSPNAIRIGGGNVGAEDGSFETDGIDYKVRHVIGGTLIEPKAAYAAQGA